MGSSESAGADGEAAPALFTQFSPLALTETSQESKTSQCMPTAPSRLLDADFEATRLCN